MTLITIVGLAVYMIGHGTRGLPQGGLIGSIAMIIGGILVLLGALI